MRTQYDLSLYGTDFKQMQWAEFKALLAGLNADTPLGRTVQIRAETDPEVIKKFTPGQKSIHDEWQKRLAKEVTEDDLDKFLAAMQRFFTGGTGKASARGETDAGGEN